MTHADKLEAARQKCGGKFGWERRDFSYVPACHTNIVKTIRRAEFVMRPCPFEHAIESAEFEADFQREEMLLDSE